MKIFAWAFIVILSAVTIRAQPPSPDNPDEFNAQDEVELLIRSLECTRSCQSNRMCPTEAEFKANEGNEDFPPRNRMKRCGICLSRCPPFQGRVGQGMKDLPDIRQIARSAVCIKDCQSPLTCPTNAEVMQNYETEACVNEVETVCENQMGKNSQDGCAELARQYLPECRNELPFFRLAGCLGCITICPPVLAIIIEFLPQLLPQPIPTLPPTTQAPALETCLVACQGRNVCFTEQQLERRRSARENQCSACIREEYCGNRTESNEAFFDVCQLNARKLCLVCRLGPIVQQFRCTACRKRCEIEHGDKFNPISFFTKLLGIA